MYLVSSVRRRLECRKCRSAGSNDLYQAAILKILGDLCIENRYVFCAHGLDGTAVSGSFWAC
jgi:hypothetical protein